MLSVCFSDPECCWVPSKCNSALPVCYLSQQASEKGEKEKLIEVLTLVADVSDKININLYNIEVMLLLNIL